MLRAGPDAYLTPEKLPLEGWLPVQVPTTVAAALGTDSVDGHSLDSHDWWFTCELPEARLGDGAGSRLRFEGLATLAEVWVDDRLMLSSANMHRCFIVPLPPGARRLSLRFAALQLRLQARHPRPRWKTGLVATQALRWFRTTLLGRASSWKPAVDPVGPWRAVHLETVRSVDLEELRLASIWREGRAVVQLGARWRAMADLGCIRAELQVAERSQPIDMERMRPDGIETHELMFEGLEPWWPHTHGTPVLYGCALRVWWKGGETTLYRGLIGFKSFEIREPEGALSLACNSKSLFVRGACWVAADARRLDADPDALEGWLRRAADAGMNMLRIVGAGVLASEAFYTLCDSLGILVWQDFLYASLDYPFEDSGFLEEARGEAREHVLRLSRHACLAVYCGNSEVEQQAAMLGLAPEAWRRDFFDRWLPELVAALHPGSAYVRSSPSGGALPFHTSSGVCQYYGVGAYRRPLTDARMAGVRFASESLALSNVPAQRELQSFGLSGLGCHDPRWKQGIPRDSGAAWDFEDVRDHYFRLLVRADPLDMRLCDTESYLRWSSLVSGEVMQSVYATWRRPGSGCQGALVWWLKDLFPGAGWGVLDCEGRPKPAYWSLKRALAARTVLIEDRGLEGCDFLVFNEGPMPLDAELTVDLWSAGRLRTLGSARRLRLEPRQSLRLGSAEVFGHFVDINHAYRFGPPGHDAVVARLQDLCNNEVAETFLFPAGMPVERVSGVLRLDSRLDGDDCLLFLQTDHLLLGVHIEAPGYEPQDNSFHLAPGIGRTVRLRRASAPRGRIRCTAANLHDDVVLPEPGDRADA